MRFGHGSPKEKEPRAKSSPVVPFGERLGGCLSYTSRASARDLYKTSTRQSAIWHFSLKRKTLIFNLKTDIIMT